MDRDIIAFRDKLIRLRESRKISARQLSLQLGKGPSYIANIESGRRLPSLEGFFDICDYFCITPAHFFLEESSEDVKFFNEIHDMDEKKAVVVRTLVELINKL